MKSPYILATGKRKTSIARVFLKKGKGAITVNDRDFDTYFPQPAAKNIALQPISLSSLENKLDLRVNVIGGGFVGQLQAVRHGIARALIVFNPELRPALKKAGLLTRDARKKERKKYGQKGARARFQFSKR